MLKGEKSIGLRFDYTDLTIGDDSISEVEFLLKSKTQYDAWYGPGTGDNWIRQWEESCKFTCEPQFRVLFSKYARISPTNEKAKYTIIYMPLHINPAYNAPNFINSKVWIVETANSNNVLAKLTIMKNSNVVYYPTKYSHSLPDMTIYYQNYAKAGKLLGQFISKNID